MLEYCGCSRDNTMAFLLTGKTPVALNPAAMLDGVIA